MLDWIAGEIDYLLNAGYRTAQSTFSVLGITAPGTAPPLRINANPQNAPDVRGCARLPEAMPRR
jgi:hypothetical protein